MVFSNSSVNSLCARRMKITSVAFLGLSVLCDTNCSIGQLKQNSADSRQISITVERLLEQAHYSRQKLDDDTAKKILDTYLEDLDYTKLFFTQEDIDEIYKKYGPTLDQDLTVGNVQPAREIYNLFKTRVTDRVAKIKELLKQDYSFKSTNTVALDRHKEPWPANATEPDNLCRDSRARQLFPHNPHHPHPHHP